MEFKYRAGDKRPPSHMSPSTTVGYFSDIAAFRVGYSQSVDFMQNPSDVCEAIYLREMEKQRIREEIIAEELACRRVLEAEVKREAMVEREMAMRRAGEIGVPNDERFSMQSGSRLFMRHFEDQQRAFTSRFLRDPLSQPPEVLLRLPEPPCTEVKASSESNKDKFIVLARPDSKNISEKKRKKSPESGLQALPLTSSKKPKEEWSCALCRVSATSEKGLNEHLRGRKHKAKEGLRAQRMAENSNTRPFPNNTGKLSQVPVVKEGKEDKLPETGNDSKQRTKLTEKGPHLPLENQGAEKSGNENSETTRMAPELKKRRKFKFWCEMCSVGVYSKVVMDDHEKGKGHRSRLEKHAKNGEALPTPTSTSSTISVIAEINQMAKDENMVTNEANENTEEGIADVDGSCPSPLTVPHPAKEDLTVYN